MPSVGGDAGKGLYGVARSRASTGWAPSRSGPSGGEGGFLSSLAQFCLASSQYPPPAAPVPRRVGKGRRLPEGLGLAGMVMWWASQGPGLEAPQGRLGIPHRSAGGFTGSLVRTGWEWEQLVAVGWGASSHTPPASVLMERGLPDLSWPLLVLGCPGSASAAPLCPHQTRHCLPRTGLPELARPRRDVWGLIGPPRAGRTSCR